MANNQPIFSLCHATARLPHGWQDACQAWHDHCDDPNRCEYLLNIHAKHATLPFVSPDFDILDEYHHIYTDLWSIWGDRFMILINKDRPNQVDSGNMLTACARGKVIVPAQDDLYPSPHWDTELLAAIPNLDAPFVLKPNLGDYHPGLITHAVTSAAYLTQFPNHEPFCKLYDGFGVDDDFTEVVRNDGVLIDAPQIVWDHRHYTNGKRAKDALDDYSARQSVWDTKHAVQSIRRAQGFPKCS